VIVDSGDEVEPESEAFSSVSVSVCDDFKALEVSDDVFAGDTLSGYAFIFCLVLFGQGMFFAALLRHNCVGVHLLQPQEPGVHHRAGLWSKPHFGLFEQMKVMAASFVVGCTDNLA
jgi:hypothetical protein